MENILDSFDIDNNFWLQNPQIKFFSIFEKLYSDDKSKNKEESSKLMWAIFLYCDPFKSKFARLYQEDKIKEIQLYYLKFNPELDEQKILIEKYQSLLMSKSKKLFKAWEDKLEERETFINKSSYTEDTWEMIDKMMASTAKMWEQYNTIKELMIEDETKTKIKGGRKESKSERGEI